MAVDPRKRQKKQERKNAKRKEKRHEMVAVKTQPIAERLAHATRHPVMRCWVAETLDVQGIGQVCISRLLPNGSVAFGMFLVDRMCLGVKDVFGDITSRSDFENRLEGGSNRPFPLRAVSAATLRHLVESAVAYARSLGLEPHPDYAKFAPIFGDVDSSQYEETWEFGQEGKPYFISGPYDTPARCRKILAALTASQGPGGFHFVMVGDDVLDSELGEGEDWDDENDELEPPEEQLRLPG